MGESKQKLSPHQATQIARLLVNFSSDTADSILQGFDRTTRSRVRAHMDDLSCNGCSTDIDSLADFAEFLYFEPDESSEQNPPAVRKPALSRLGGSLSSGLAFNDILGFNDSLLDSLLKATPAELTISVLCCSPESFVQRVLGRLSGPEAQLVRDRINETNTVEFSEMQTIHERYCEFATRLIDTDD